MEEACKKAFTRSSLPILMSIAGRQASSRFASLTAVLAKGVLLNVFKVSFMESRPNLPALNGEVAGCG